MLTRRKFLQVLLSGTGYISLGILPATKARADDDGGNDNDGNDNDNDNDNDGNDDNGDEDNSNDDNENEDEYTSTETDQDDALIARNSGNAMPTGDLIAMLEKRMRAEVIDIRLVNQRPTAYDVKMINAEGRIGTVRVAAKNFKIIRVTGF